MDDKYMQEMYSAILERTIKRLWILAIILIIALVGSNIAWVRYEKEYVVDVDKELKKAEKYQLNKKANDYSMDMIVSEQRQLYDKYR